MKPPANSHSACEQVWKGLELKARDARLCSLRGLHRIRCGGERAIISPARPLAGGDPCAIVTLRQHPAAALLRPGAVDYKAAPAARLAGMEGAVTKIVPMQAIVICFSLSSKLLCHKGHSAAMIAGV
ncbi:hypothetical protein ABID08_001864 [Rhizobium binae]|uniref:Uncharacterized protein n=1 Tax=Rhizobium binae TaxID=1138190 RepID=A0ABV2MDJ9_9HYPH|nr:hypothetical protein [Rhizobium binae]MBX4993665.1 hypothetical protein [Rhizobium binae]QSY83441.1 hypothetical protein J2J99_06465 [Rhizobium binae]